MLADPGALHYTLGMQELEQNRDFQILGWAFMSLFRGVMTGCQI